MLSLVQEPVDLFDLRALFRAVDDARVDRGLTWTALAAEARVAVSTIRRFAHASDAEADGVLAVVCWLGVAPEAFIRGSRVEGEPLLASNGCMVRVDMAAVHDADGARRTAQHQRRTTVQRLARVAQRAQLPVAAFTRHTDG